MFNVTIEGQECETLHLFFCVRDDGNDPARIEANLLGNI